MPKPFLSKRASGLYARFLVPVDLRQALGCRFLVRALPVLRRCRPTGRCPHGCGTLGSIQSATNRDDERRHQGHLATGARERAQRPDHPAGAAAQRADFGRGGNQHDRGPPAVPADRAGLERSRSKGPAHGGHAWVGAPRPPAPPAPPAGPLLSERIDVYLNDMRRAQRAVRNVMDTEYTLRLFLALGDDKPIEEVTATDVRAFLMRWRSTRPTPARKPCSVA